MCSLINFFKVYISLTKINRVHSASDIDTYHIGNCFILNCHCGSNGTAFTGMNVRHDSYL